MVKRLLNTLLFALCLSAVPDAFCASASDTDTRPGIFDPNFRTLKITAEDNFMAPPVIRMNTEDRLIITFDEIGEDNSFLEYRLIHCDSDWQPSRLLESEYIDGFNSQRIEDYESSYSTFVHFVNYRIVIPDANLRILHSGNYLLQVYNPDEPDDVILQTRFQVSENVLNITGDANSRTDRGHYSKWQQLSMQIDTQGLGNINPYQDISVYVSQNMRQDTRRRIMSPLRLNGKVMVYEHQDDLIFPASNEYRRFESVSNSFAGLNVDSLRYMGSNYHVWLKHDSTRAEREYSYDRTQHGRFLVREYNSADSDLGADYITVYFMLETPEQYDGEVYVDGEFTNGRYDKNNLMTYRPDLGAYTAEIPLKQGAYNYQYVTFDKQHGEIPTPATIEGDKYETENEYDISVYFRPPGARADRLAGTASIWSR